MYIHRNMFTSYTEYLKEYRAMCSKYDYKVRHNGGWMFFKTQVEYNRWRNR